MGNNKLHVAIKVLYGFLNPFVKGISGEFLLDGQPNGGTAILLRSLFVSAWLYLLALGLNSFSRPGMAMGFSASQFWIEVHDTLPWLGAIFAGVYAALYARYSSQWSYLAALYNDQMAAHLSLDVNNKAASLTYTKWQAAFIEDAVDLHLATKPMFAVAVSQMLEKDDVKAEFVRSTHGGAAKVEKLQQKLKAVLSGSASV